VKNGNKLRSSFDSDYLGVLDIVHSLRRGTHLPLRSPVMSDLPATGCFKLIQRGRSIDLRKGFLLGANSLYRMGGGTS
jgi:hypothetical protein